jgi:hypothetical protein
MITVTARTMTAASRDGQDVDKVDIISDHHRGRSAQSSTRRSRFYCNPLVSSQATCAHPCHGLEQATSCGIVLQHEGDHRATRFHRSMTNGTRASTTSGFLANRSTPEAPARACWTESQSVCILREPPQGLERTLVVSPCHSG